MAQYYVKPPPYSLLSGFGDAVSVEATPRVQIDAVYGVLETDHQTLVSGGSVAVDDATFVLNSGTGFGDFAVLRSKRIVRYRPGQATRFRFTAGFPETSEVGDFRGAGAFSSTDGLLVMSVAGTPAVCRRIPGTSAIWRLTITTGTTGSETVTVRLNGVDFDVAAGALLSSEELASTLAAATYTGWTSEISPTSNGATVTWIQAGPATTGTDFSLSSTGDAEGTFTEIETGSPNSYADLRFQSSWNLDTLDGSKDAVTNPSHFSLDFSKLNVYQIDHTHLGTGPITWSIMDGEGRWIAFHREELVNSRTRASQNNPAYRLGWFASQAAGGESVEVLGASAAGFVCGPVAQPLRNSFGVKETSFTAATTGRVVIALRGRGEFANLISQREILLEEATAATETSNRALVIDVVLNPTFSSALEWEYVDEANSAVEVAYPGSASAVTISGGITIASLPTARQQGGGISLGALDTRIDQGDVIAIVVSTATSTAAIAATAVWRED